MLDITKLLKEKLGEAYTAEIDKAVKEELKAEKNNYVSKAEYEAKLKELTELSSKLETQEKEREANMSLQEKYNKLKAEHEASAKKYTESLNAIRLEGMLSKTGVKNTKALKALLDSSKIAFGENGEITGLEEQIEAIKKSDGYLFESDNQAPQGVGGFPNVQSNINTSVQDFASFMKFTPITGKLQSKQ